MHLALFLTADGIHHGGWRHPSSQPGRADFAFFRDLAAQAEAARFDLLFVADKLAIDASYGGDFAHALRHRASRWPEPLTLLSALAPLTLLGLTPYEFICKCWTTEPDRFRLNPHHQSNCLYEGWSCQGVQCGINWSPCDYLDSLVWVLRMIRRGVRARSNLYSVSARSD